MITLIVIIWLLFGLGAWVRALKYGGYSTPLLIMIIPLVLCGPISILAVSIAIYISENYDV